MLATIKPIRSSADGHLEKDGKRQSVWWVIHSWVGLKLSIFMVWVLLTGTLAVFSAEMDWLARPSLRVEPRNASHASWGTIVASAAKAVPGAHLSAIYAPPHAWFAAEAIAETHPGQRVRIHINPYDGHVQGVAPWMSFQRFFREMHRHLLLPVRYGVPIVSSLSILLLLSIVTGLVTYKKFWRGFFRAPRGGNTRRLTGDLHRLGGLWALWFVLLITLTSVWYLVESLGGDAPISRQPRLEGTSSFVPDTGAIDALVALGKQAYPGLEVKELRMPKGKQPLGIFGQADAILVRDRTNGVWIDPQRATVLDVWKGETLSLHQRISEMADPLHFGTWGGMITKIAWFVFGLAMVALAVTGIMIYSLRLDRAYAEAYAYRGEDHGGLYRAWRGMGRWGYVGAAAVLISLLLLPGWFTA
jgi:uncharacterized iron-regulated membrane protein